MKRIRKPGLTRPFIKSYRIIELVYTTLFFNNLSNYTSIMNRLKITYIFCKYINIEYFIKMIK